MTQLPCPSCQAPLDPTAIDREREIATCRSCGRLVDLRARVPPARGPAPAPAVAPVASSARARPAVQLPAGMSMTTDMLGKTVTIRRSWLRTKHWLLLMLFAGASATLAYFWATAGASAWLIVGTIFVLSWNYNLLCMFLNTTAVSATPEGITVRHGPLPSLFGFNRQARRDDLKQLYAAEHGAAFAVRAHLHSQDTPLILVAPLISASQALFIEQQLERALGLVDYAVQGELDAPSPATVDGKPRRGAKPGAAAALAIPVIAGGGIALFALVANTEVNGTLQASGALGTWSFAPDDCHSGQREGFGGVVLTSHAAPGHLVRVVSDPVRGMLLVAAMPGQPNQVIDHTGCRRFDLRAARTNTSINEIWVVDGSVAVECDGLAGRVEFTGCH